MQALLLSTKTTVCRDGSSCRQSALMLPHRSALRFDREMSLRGHQNRAQEQPPEICHLPRTPGPKITHCRNGVIHLGGPCRPPAGCQPAGASGPSAKADRPRLLAAARPGPPMNAERQAGTADKSIWYLVRGEPGEAPGPGRGGIQGDFLERGMCLHQVPTRGMCQTFVI